MDVCNNFIFYIYCDNCVIINDKVIYLRDGIVDNILKVIFLGCWVIIRDSFLIVYIGVDNVYFIDVVFDNDGQFE